MTIFAKNSLRRIEISTSLRHPRIQHRNTNKLKLSFKFEYNRKKHIKMLESNVPPVGSQTEVVDGPVAAEAEPVLRLRLRKPRTDRRVVFMEGTVDNEHMNKKKSKCCCIYKKPTVFGESSSESEDECEHCYGHTEVKVKKKQNSTVTAEPDAATTSATPQPTEQPKEPDNGDKGESPPGDNSDQPKV